MKVAKPLRPQRCRSKPGCRLLNGAVKGIAPVGCDVVIGVGQGHAASSKNSQPVSIFLLLARGNPAGGDTLRAVRAEPSERREPVVRSRDRYLSRTVVEQVRTAVRGRHPAPAGQPDAWLPAVALAS